MKLLAYFLVYLFLAPAFCANAEEPESNDGDEDEVILDASASSATEDDEFEGGAPIETKQDPDSPRKRPASGFKLRQQDHYLYEALGMAVLVMFILNYLSGRQANTAIARAWGKTYADLYDKNFSAPSIADEGSTQLQLFEESSSEFRLYSTGRVACSSMTSVLELKKRQDLFFTVYDLLNPTKDTLTLEVAMNDEDMDTFVFVLCRKKFEKQLRKDCIDIATFANAVHPSLVPSELSDDGILVLSDCPEIVSDLLPSSVVAAVRKNAYFRYLHFSDQDASPARKVLRFVFNVPPASAMNELSSLMRMAFFYIDRVDNLKLPTAAKTKAERLRTIAQEQFAKQKHAERQELAQKRKAEKRRKEEEDKEAARANRPTDEVRRLEAKEARQQAKKNGAKVKMARVG